MKTGRHKKKRIIAEDERREKNLEINRKRSKKAPRRGHRGGGVEMNNRRGDVKLKGLGETASWGPLGGELGKRQEKERDREPAASEEGVFKKKTKL